MPDTLRADIAQLTALFVESILYGVYLITFCQMLTRILLVSHSDVSHSPSSSRSLKIIKPLSKIHLPTLLVALLLWVNGTLNLSLGLLRTIQTYVYRLPATHFNWIGITKMFTVDLQIMLADGMLVYRCWRVYRQSWKIILFPLLLWIVGAGATIWTLVLNLNASVKELYVGLQYPLSCVFWSFTMGLNIYTTSCIIYRIYQVDKEVCRPVYSSSTLSPNHKTTPAIRILTRQTNSRLQAAIKIIAMSGLIYTLTSITVFASELAKSSAIYITSAADIMAVGIAFNLMIISIDKERSKDEEPSAHSPADVHEGGREKVTGIRFDSRPEYYNSQADPHSQSRSYSQSQTRSDFVWSESTQVDSREYESGHRASALDVDVERGYAL